jgi:hypothetical protein
MLRCNWARAAHLQPVNSAPSPNCALPGSSSKDPNPILNTMQIPQAGKPHKGLPAVLIQEIDMRLVIALGGNALLRRGEAMTAENQRDNVRVACEQIAKIALDNQLVVAHGNGPQVGLLALQGNAYDAKNPYPLDVLGAETEGMIGYMIEQELGNLLPVEVPFATLLTQVEVDPADPAFQNMSKPIGPVYAKAEAEQLAAEKGWPAQDPSGSSRSARSNGCWRRAPSSSLRAVAASRPCIRTASCWAWKR